MEGGIKTLEGKLKFIYTVSQNEIVPVCAAAVEELYIQSSQSRVLIRYAYFRLQLKD